MNKESRILSSGAYFLPAVAATIITVIGLGLLIAALAEGEDGRTFDLAFLLLFPGELVAIVLARFLLPGGIHSIGLVFWVVLPITWSFYFILTWGVLYLRQKRIHASDSGTK